MFTIENLTPRQAEVLKFLRRCREEGRSAPTYREIADHFGFKSPKASADHVRALEKKGYVRHHAGRSRGIEVVFSEDATNDEIVFVPLLGNIPAGCPEIQTECCHGRLAVDKVMLGEPRGHRLFALQVNGKSMKGRGIHEGDWIVADADASPREGDVVVALIDGRNTLKTLARKKGKGCFLKAENPKCSDLIPIEEMVIQGVVKAVLRRMC